MQTIQSQKPFQFSFSSLIPNLRLPERGASFLALIVGATVLFEAFNYSTTEHALGGVMGGLNFLGFSWATILALAFCVIDFAGIARLFSPEDRAADGRMEGIYLLAAWLLAGMINAATTWWAMTIALLGQPILGNELVTRQDLILYVPILVAGAVWLIRILLIGTLTLSGGKQKANPMPPVQKKPLPVPAIPASAPVAAMVRPFTGGRS
ncbi:MAG: hypothetical protein WBM17_08355 [Anaerolineales bacterium]